jgi:two-component system CheB/CheR fusion protein
VLGASVAFVDVTAQHRLQLELERSRQEIETAHEELQSSNEELQSTVEELETTNEELQASNEELETMNEELESTNSELQAINADLRTRTSELDRLNLFMQSILTSLETGVTVLDENLRVDLWNRRAEDLWGLRDSEVVGRPFLHLDIGLPVLELQILANAGLRPDGEATHQVVEATTRRGRHIRCRVTATPLVATSGHVAGVVLLMEELPVAQRS